MQILLDLKTTPFNLDYTLDCGQVFRWEKRGDCWYGVVQETIIILRQDHDKLVFTIFPENKGIDFVESYLRLNDSLPQIVSEIDKDLTIRKAVAALYGLRITRQDPWECLISYMCATFSNISRIKGMIRNLSRKFGKELLYDGLKFYTFPSTEALAKATLRELYDCGLGFRAKYVHETSKMIMDLDLNVETLRRLVYNEAKKQLLGFPGIGPKVADCVLLFSLDKLEAFPVDVWIRRILHKYYYRHFSDSGLRTREGFTSGQYEQICAFGKSYFGKYAGYAQEYLFHYYRLNKTSEK